LVDTDIVLSVMADLPPERLAAFTRDLARDLSRASIPARVAERAPAPAERGDPVTLGTLALALITSGSVGLLIGCLKTYLARESKLIFKINRPDGYKFEINAKNIDDPKIRQALGAAISRT
jgi:Effector Associated Constant Component 1